MAIYYVNLIAIVALGLLLTVWRPNRAKKAVYVLLTVSFFWFIATFRKDIGWDYNSYIGIFEMYRGIPFSQVFSIRYEPLFGVLNWFLAKFVTSTTVMYGIYSFIILAPVAWFLYKKCDDVMISTWMYVTLTFLYANMNFIRQSIACSIGLFAFEAFRRKETVKFLIIAFIMGMFHYTALIIIPVYILCHIPFNKITISVYSSVVFLAFIFSGQIIDLVTDYIFQSYKNSVYVRAGLGPIFLLIPFLIMFACIALYLRWRKQDEFAEVMLKLSIVNATFWLFGALKHMILERFSMFTYIYTLAFLPMALSALKASPEVIAERDQLAELADTKKNLPDSQKNKLKKLNDEIRDHKYYYLSAIAALFLVTFIYNYFGMYNGAFHKVFPYQSVIDWLNTPPPVVQGPVVSLIGKLFM